MDYIGADVESERKRNSPHLHSAAQCSQGMHAFGGGFAWITWILGYLLYLLEDQCLFHHDIALVSSLFPVAHPQLRGAETQRESPRHLYHWWAWLFKTVHPTFVSLSAPRCFNMVFFPLELIELIVGFADDDVCRQLLTVDRSFQAAVERRTWVGYIHDTTKSIRGFLDRYRGARCRYLRYIGVYTPFPYLKETKETRIKCRETAEELQAHNERFTRHITDILAALKTLEERELPHNRPTGIELFIKTPDQADNNRKFCYHRRFNSWRLRLLNPDNLPTLSSIRTFRIGPADIAYNRSVRPLDYGFVPALVSKFPNLEVLDCPDLDEDFPEAYEDSTVSHFTRHWEGPWRDTRHAFGDTMLNATTLPTKISNAHLVFGQHILGVFTDQSQPLPDLVKPLFHDPLSTGLRVLSQRVVNLKIRACVDSTLFWPAPDDAKTEPPSWPYLKDLLVEFRPSSPSGTWYFNGPRGEGQDATGYEVTESHYPPVEENAEDKQWDDAYDWEGGRFDTYSPNMFRIAPNDEVIEPFLEAFVKALENMPCLESADLFTYLSYWPREDMGQGYPEEGTEYIWGLRYHFPQDGGSPLVEWRVGDWRPSERLLRRFRNLGYHKGGKPLKEKWMACQYASYQDPWHDLSHHRSRYVQVCTEIPNDRSD